MKYVLRKAALEIAPEIEITAEEYSAFQKARSILLNCLAIEEKYEIVIVNYLDFERQILDTIAHYMVREDLDYSHFFEARQGLNIRLVNLLTATRMYVDQLGQNVRECIPDDPDAEGAVKEVFSKEYDQNKDYRFMDALRNHVQHRGIPVHWIEHGAQWTSLEDDGFLEYYIDLASERSVLEEDPKFKNTVLAKLDKRIDLKETTRSYVESMSSVHHVVRNMIAQSVSNARALIQDAHHRYSAVYSGSLIGLTACKLSDDGQVSSIPLLLDWDDIRIKLQKENKRLRNLRKRYVTGKIRHHSE